MKKVAHAQGSKELPLLSRRTLLKAAGLGGIYLISGKLIYDQVWQLSPPAQGKSAFSSEEFTVCQKMAEAFFPGPPTTPLSAEEAKLPDFIDAYVAGLYETEQKLFKLLLKVLDVQPVFFRGRTFSELSLLQRQEVLQAWATSRMSARRAAYQSLRFTASMGYFENAEVRSALGLRTGCPLPGRATRLSPWKGVSAT